MEIKIEKKTGAPGQRPVYRLWLGPSYYEDLKADDFERLKQAVKEAESK